MKKVPLYVKISATLKKKADKLAKAEDLSLRQWISRLIKRADNG